MKKDNGKNMILFNSLFGAFLIVFPIFIIKIGKTNSREYQQKAMAQAISKGHFVEAERCKMYAPALENPGKPLDSASRTIYKYEVGGKTYKYRTWYTDPPYYLTLYYLDDPKKAGSEGNIPGDYTKLIIIFLFVVVLLYFIQSVNYY